MGEGATDWRDNDPQVEHLVEIYQGLRDTYEHPGAPRLKTLEPAPEGWKPGHVWNALRKGYRLGFIASSDHFSTQQERVDFKFLEGANLGSETSYYYLRVLQQDGELAWASPVWVDYSSRN